jgi:DUF971 family protein
LQAVGEAARNNSASLREFPRNMAPLELKLLDNRRVLAVTWGDGAITRLPAGLLRRNSRAASALRAALDDDPLPPDERIQLSDIQLIGAYAVQLSFSDGHDRGIYPWSYLRQLAAQAV